MDKIINGTALAKKHEEILREKIANMKNSGLRQNDDRLEASEPTMVSFCNSGDPASVMYTQMKQKKAIDLGINFITENYSSGTSREDLENLVKKYAADEKIDGIMVQLPLPENLENSKNEILSLIPPEKDVDGLTGKGPFLPATIKGVLSILNNLKFRGFTSKEVKPLVYAVVGSTGEVGQKMVLALKQIGIDPLEINRKSGNFSEIKNAQIVISATGINGIIKPEQIQEEAILIDIGLGDFDPECFQKASKYTPKIGGVGPMTVISLMENVVEVYQGRMVKYLHGVNGFNETVGGFKEASRPGDGDAKKAG